MWLLSALLGARLAHARLDVEDRGPLLDAGAFAMRVTNAGILGNAFFDVGRSFDSSLEYPRGSGHEALAHAELWVGARNEAGRTLVSGGPKLEWRPTLAAADVVHGVHGGTPGTLYQVDDDGDGRVDEDAPNGLDDDGDGRVDEDCGAVADQWYMSRYRDDEPEAVAASQGGTEPHEPMHLEVVQEARAWAVPGFDRIAGYAFRITNVGREVLRDVRCGVLADLDSRLRNDAGGHLDDRLGEIHYVSDLPEGRSTTGRPNSRKGGGTMVKTCVTHFEGTVPIVYDGRTPDALPVSAIVGLAHTTDPLGFVVNFAFPGAREAQAAARAPRRDTTFRYAWFAKGLPAGAGGPPIFDADRYAAMAGDYPMPLRDQAGDWEVLLSCGPFVRLDPGQSVEFSVAFVVGATPDSVAMAALNARVTWRGTRFNRQADISTDGFDEGRTGITGHEVCYEPPPGVVFDYEPHCPTKYYDDIAYKPLTDPLLWLHPTQVTYQTGSCVWTDFDCDACTGLDGRETAVPWLVSRVLPDAPRVRVSAADTLVTVAWDNTPEITLRHFDTADATYRFGGYRIYRLDDWRRDTLVPPTAQWQRIASLRPDDLAFVDEPLAGYLDTNVPVDSVLYGEPRYAPGRYRFADGEVALGFDYLYAVTTLVSKVTFVQGAPVLEELESPLRANFNDRVVPHAQARAASGGVWVVPNPYHGGAAWERQPVSGDLFTRHVDFLGLPRARARIRIYTLAGDLVRELDHDGSNGDGQASWNLISRNGQDIESGVYLFSVDSPLGHQVGRFVILR